MVIRWLKKKTCRVKPLTLTERILILLIIILLYNL